MKTTGRCKQKHLQSVGRSTYVVKGVGRCTYTERKKGAERYTYKEKEGMCQRPTDREKSWLIKIYMTNHIKRTKTRKLCIHKHTASSQKFFSWKQHFLLNSDKTPYLKLQPPTQYLSKKHPVSVPK